MVTGYEDVGEEFWYIDPDPADGCQRVFVGAAYRGARRENYHIHWRCRTPKPGDLKVTATSGEIEFAARSDEKARWKDAAEGDMLAPGSFLRIGPNSELTWRRNLPRGDVGVLRASEFGKIFRIEPTHFAALKDDPAPAADSATENAGP